MAQLIPELAVTDIAASRNFYEALETVYDRPEDGFARQRLDAAHITFDQLGIGRDPDTLGAADRPFGRGLNIQIEVPRLDTLLAFGRAPRLSPETRWYRAGPQEIGQRQARVEDPDGRLLRFCELVGRRLADQAPALDAATGEDT